MNYVLSLALLPFLFTGCSNINFEQKPAPETSVSYDKYVLKNVRSANYTKPYAILDNIHQNLNGAIVAIADQLLTTNIFENKNTSIILTSFADLDKLNKTTTFGRLLGESMFNELHVRKFKVTDFRGQNAVSVNADGEFHITRDVNKLRDHIEATEYVVVGTYVKFENDTILINARILDSASGAIISTARVIYKPRDCSLYNMCIQRPDEIRHENSVINIVTDNCSVVGCPTEKCKDNSCKK